MMLSLKSMHALQPMQAFGSECGAECDAVAHLRRIGRLKALKPNP